MLGSFVTFAILALIAGILGFFPLAGSLAVIAKLLLLVFLAYFFEYSESRDDVEDQHPTTGRRVDALLEAPESDLPFLELPDGFDQVPDAAAQAVELPDREGVTLPEVRDGLIEPRSLGTRDIGLVREKPLATSTIQGIGLEIEVQLGGRDARIAD